MNDIILQGILAVGATVGMSFLFHVPTQLIPVCGIIGGLGWSLYEACMQTSAPNAAIASFLAAALVGFLSEICARIFHETTTVFTIPGILPLVPGAYIFHAMDAMLNDTVGTSTYGIDTLKIAGAIAFGLLAVGAVFKIVHTMYRKTRVVTDDMLDAIKKPIK